MSVLNNKPQMFTIYFPSNFWYSEVTEKWEPLIKRMKLPFMSVSDFMNSQIQAVTFPGMNMDIATQRREQYEVAYYGGKELEQLITKELSITFKLTESYMSYWIIWDQMDLYLHYVDNPNDKKPCWMEPIKIGFLNDAGFQLLEFTFNEITPINVGELNLSYAATVASYNTFQWRLKFNTFDID